MGNKSSKGNNGESAVEGKAKSKSKSPSPTSRTHSSANDHKSSGKKKDTTQDTGTKMKAKVSELCYLSVCSIHYFILHTIINYLVNVSLSPRS